jgi:hypothetical protein
VLARHARNRRLPTPWTGGHSAPSPSSLGARAYYDQLRARGKTHHQALRQLADRWVGILRICLERRCAYDETAAWQHPGIAAAA